MAEPWYWKLGFYANPFSIKPGSLSDGIVKHPVKKIIRKIRQGGVQLIEAPHGSGKTAVLKSIISRFGGKGNLVYCSCIRGESLGLRSLLRNSGLAGKLFGKMPREAIILVDEVQDVSTEDAEELGSLMESSVLKSIVFFGTASEGLPLPKNLAEPLKGSVTTLSSLTPEESIEMVRARVGKLKLLPDYVIREICVRSSGNPRRLLEYCEALCRKAVEASVRELAVSHVKTLLKDENKPVRKTRRRVR